ncbi:family 16 glycosylhydrolase [Nakamurella sp. YIM 132087]|uniref:Family 16 glycosylhydrolase n=1 Tax=Nakamurella alba TaxID=2665158 RepID=A0A7K1FQ07_9ACTN|nr:glycoside hydrolase family 16 protein [Nakamurella alba]MTD14894.1 family 16 glycosylhydrolase [Nakamurella alba]
MKEFRHLSDRGPLLRSRWFFVAIAALVVVAGVIVVRWDRPATAAAPEPAPSTSAASSSAAPSSAPPSSTAPSSEAPSSEAPSSSATTPTPSTAEPLSGVAAPVGDEPGWRQVFVDDFSRTELGDDWDVYSGPPGGDPYTIWDPSHVQLDGDSLLLAGFQEDGQWVTGGVSNWPVAQTYGRWEVRFRAMASDEITYHFLLWPQSENWPPEIDFLEDFSGDRSQASGFVHYIQDGRRQKVQKDVEADFNQWHTAGVIWEPERVTFTLDGEPWGIISGDMVPDEPMWLALQQQAGGCQRSADYGYPFCPVAGVPDEAWVQIDWVSVYAPA